MSNERDTLMNGPESDKYVLKATSDIVVALISQGKLTLEQVPEIISIVRSSLVALTSPPASAQAAEPLVPAVPVKKSVFPDYIVCLEDGRKLKMLKRHLSSAYGLTPSQYRERWGLPDSYPMVAPNYAEKRSALAREIGLGRNRKAV